MECNFEPAQDRPEAMGAKMLGESGKVRRPRARRHVTCVPHWPRAAQVMLYRSSEGHGAKDMLKFQVASLWEILSDGSDADAGGTKHGFNSFSQVEFTPSAFERLQYDGDGPMVQQFNLTVGITAVNSTFSAWPGSMLGRERAAGLGARSVAVGEANHGRHTDPLTSPCSRRHANQLLRRVWHHRKRGRGHQGQEWLSGSAKINMELRGWTWCLSSTGPPCYGMDGEHVDVTFAVTVRAAGRGEEGLPCT